MSSYSRVDHGIEVSSDRYHFLTFGNKALMEAVNTWLEDLKDLGWPFRHDEWQMTVLSERDDFHPDVISVRWIGEQFEVKTWRPKPVDGSAQVWRSDCPIPPPLAILEAELAQRQKEALANGE